MTLSRLQRIEAALERQLTPQTLEVVDESHLHEGHAGAREGKGHFRVTIVSEQFEGLAPLARHRMVFAALAELMRTDIHALSIHASTVAESSSN